jgi:2,3-dihydroxybenzoate decarboxylase
LRASWKQRKLGDVSTAEPTRKFHRPRLGFKGALVNGQTNGHYLDADMYLPFWERVQDLGVPIYLHPGDLADHPAMFAGRPELNGAVWAWTAETASHALRLVFGGTFTRFPKLKIILGHMGETLRSCCGASTADGNASLARNSHRTRYPPPSSSATSSSPRPGVCAPGPLADAIAALGEDSVMFSVDYPYEDTQIAAAFIESAPISEVVRAKVCHGNAERLLQL